MDKVSNRVENGVESAYFDVKYRPTNYKGNYNLDLQCSSILTYMALADLYRTNETFKTVREAFLKALSECKNEEEIKGFAQFMRKVSQIGGYATEFYNNNASLLNSNGIIHAQKAVSAIEEEKKKPVSKLDDHGIESKYFDVKYRPTAFKENFELDLKCSYLLTYMALADATRRQKQIDSLMYHFSEALTLCKTPNELVKLRTFMGIAAKQGGYASEFLQQVNDLISEKGKSQAQQYLVTHEEKKKTSSGDLEAFKEKLRVANIRLEEMQNSPTKDDEEVAALLTTFNELQSTLYKFNGIINKEFISECDETLESSISYLKGLYQKLEEISEITRSM